MNVVLLEIILVDDVWLRNCPDARPCVVIEIVATSSYVVMLVSGAFAMRRANIDFPITDYYSEFPKTGLSKPSFVLGDEIHEIDKKQILKKLGKLEGQLAADFKRWAGL